MNRLSKTWRIWVVDEIPYDSTFIRTRTFVISVTIIIGQSSVLLTHDVESDKLTAHKNSQLLMLQGFFF